MSQKTADVLVIGGGVAGLSTALQLARRGKSVIVLERGQLGSGSTGRAAGLLGQFRGTAASTRMPPRSSCNVSSVTVVPFLVSSSSCPLMNVR